MRILAVPIGWLLEQLYSLIGDYGLTLIALTVIVKGCLYPLYAMQTKSTAKMSTIQPKMKALQSKYANDPETLKQKQSELYKEEGINPAGGCLPMLIQMPIIFGLFGLLRNPIAYISGDMLWAVHESFLWITDLSQPDKWILPIAAAVTTYISFSMTQNLTQGAPGGMGGMDGNGMMKVMKYFFPIMILWMARSFPAGLAIYWFIGQFMQIFFNIRMSKIRLKMRAESEYKKKKK